MIILRFDLYFAGSQNQLAEDYMMTHDCNRLLSYYNDKSIINKWLEYKKNNPQCINKLFIDCGAYTAFTQDVIIDIDTYVNYINEIIDYVDIVASLDVIGGKGVSDTDKKTYENYLYLKQHIKNPHKLLPTFHQGDKLEYLEKYLNDKDIHYMALGGLVGSNKESLTNFFKTCYTTINKVRPDMCVHAFGMTSKPLLKSFPFTSADSTGWIMAAANGAIMSEWGVINVSEKTKGDKDNYFNFDPITQSKIKSYVEQHGFTMEECCSDYKVRTLLNIIYLKEFSDKHKPTLKPFARPLF